MVRPTDRPAMTIAVDLGRKATKQTNKKQSRKFIRIGIKKKLILKIHFCNCIQNVNLGRYTINSSII